MPARLIKDLSRPPIHPVLKVHLSIQDTRECLAFFHAIKRYNETHPVQKQKVYEGSGDHISVGGLLGEMAFGVAFGLSRAYEVGKFQGHDYRLRSDLRVDVKWAQWHDRGLLVQKKVDPTDPGTDLYCLVTGFDSQYHIQGYAWADEILVPECQGSNPHLPKDAYYMVKAELRDPRHLALPVAALVMGHRIRNNGLWDDRQGE